MTRLSKPSDDVRKGAWTAEEDEKLRIYVETYGTGHWRSVGKKAGTYTNSRLLYSTSKASDYEIYVRRQVGEADDLGHDQLETSCSFVTKTKFRHECAQTTAGLQRCGKSCRLRWTNYLRPDIRHGSFTADEEDLIVKLHATHGSR
jgi:hypothetical protein